MMTFVAGLTLFVEGNVDAPILEAINGVYNLRITIRIGGSKSGLISKVVDARKESNTNPIYLLRDRDFDFDVEEAQNIPCKIPLQGSECYGWHWSRHEMENYLLEPEILSRYLSLVHKQEIRKETVQEEICKAAANIRVYQVARRTIGISKRRALLPPPHNLETRPDGVEEFKLPTDLGRDYVYGWVIQKTSDFLSQVHETLYRDSVNLRYDESDQFYSQTNCSNIDWVLQYFSGKDLFAALKPWFESLGINRNTKKFVEDDLVPWVSENMDKLIMYIPEWGNLTTLLRQLN